jgi:hypothetical protein
VLSFFRTTTNITDSEAHEEVEEEQWAASTELRSTPSRFKRRKTETDPMDSVCQVISESLQRRAVTEQECRKS